LANTLDRDARRAGDRRIVAESDGIMRRVRDDDIGVQYRMVKARAAGHFAREVAAPATEFGTAFLLLVLVLDLLSAHLQLVVVVPALEEEVDPRQNRQAHQHLRE